MIWLSSITTEDSSTRLLSTTACEVDNVGSMRETSWYTTSRTVPPSVICGLTRSMRPMSLRSKVWNGVTVVVLPVVA